MPSYRHYTASMAADPALPQEEMQLIAVERPDLLPALASNPSLYLPLREWLEKHPDPAVQAALIAQQGDQPSSPQLDDPLSEAPKESPALGDSLSHTSSVKTASSVNNRDRKRARGKRALMALTALVLIVLVDFGVNSFAIRDGQANQANQATQATQATLKKPAPEGALNVSGFASRTNISDTPGHYEGNLQCQFTQDSDGKELVKCTVWKYTFDPGVVCTVPGAPVTYELYAEGPAHKRCDENEPVSGMPKAEYETAMAQNGFACTLERFNGIICWSERSGEGFQIQKRLDRTFS